MDFGLGKAQPTYTILNSGSDRQWIKAPNSPRVLYDINKGESYQEWFMEPIGHGLGIWIDERKVVMVPRPEQKQTPFKDQHLNTSGLCVTRDEALDYFAFVMMTAANLFEAIEDDRPSRTELVRILRSRGESEDGPMIGAALAYFDTAKKIHDDMKSED